MENFKSPDLTQGALVAPLDMSDLTNYTAQQLLDMAKAEAQQGSGNKTYGGFGKSNVGDNAQVSNQLHNNYLSNMSVFYGNFKGQNITSQQSQGTGSPFDTARSRFSPNQAQTINF
jgi:hypothetical protein